MQNETADLAALFPGAGAPAKAFLALLAGPEGRQILAAHGVR